MTVSAEYRAQNHENILRVAARLFRAHGYGGVNVDRIMGEAGLTRGTFYTYFKSKKALFAEAISFEPDFQRRLAERAPHSDMKVAAAHIAADYLDPSHRDLVWPGCALASLSQDAARGDASAQVAFAMTIEGLAGEFARGLEGNATGRERALQAIAMAVGGLILAKACDGHALADSLSEAATRGVEKILND